MGNNPAENPGEGQGFLKEAGEQLFDQLHFGEWLEQYAEEDPNSLEDMMSKLGKNMSDFINESGKISAEALRKSLTFTEKFHLMISKFLGNFFADRIDAELPDDIDLGVRSFDQEMAAIDEIEGSAYVDERNIVYPAGNPMDLFGSVWSLMQRFSEQGENPKELFINTESRFVFGIETREGGMNPGRFPMYRAFLKKINVDLTVLSPGESISKPGPREIQVVYIQDKSIPMTADGKSVRVDDLNWYKDLYEAGNNTWYLTSELLAGVYMAKGMTKDEALEKAGIENPEQDFLAQINILEKQLRPSASTKPEDESEDEEKDEKADEN